MGRCLGGMMRAGRGEGPWQEQGLPGPGEEAGP